jgi:hypothetical protein
MASCYCSRCIFLIQVGDHTLPLFSVMVHPFLRLPSLAKRFLSLSGTSCCGRLHESFQRLRPPVCNKEPDLTSASTGQVSQEYYRKGPRLRHDASAMGLDTQNARNCDRKAAFQLTLSRNFTSPSIKTRNLSLETSSQSS